MTEIDHLFDTCTITREIHNEDMLDNVIGCCENKKVNFSISNAVLDELYKPAKKPNDCSDEDYQAIGKISEYVKFNIKTRKINLINDCQNETLKILQEIRRRYYSWMTNPKELNRLISQGEITKEQIKTRKFRNKDMGECSLVAIALTDPENYIIVSEDKGRVYKHPDINIFDYYKYKGIKIYKFCNWPLYKYLPKVAD